MEPQSRRRVPVELAIILIQPGDVVEQAEGVTDASATIFRRQHRLSIGSGLGSPRPTGSASADCLDLNARSPDSLYPTQRLTQEFSLHGHFPEMTR